MSARCIAIVLLVVALLPIPRAPVVHEAARADARAGRFDPESLKPARGSARSAALEAREAGEPAQVRVHALAGLARAKAGEAPLLRWIAAQASRELGDLSAASDLLLPLARSDHPLASWAKLSLAECLESRDPVHALALLDGLLAPTRDVQGWPGRAAAERARARVLIKLGRRDDAILAFEQIAGQARDESTTMLVLVPLSELLAKGGERDRLRALSLARRIALRAPDTRSGKRAEELAASLLRELPESLRRGLADARPEDRLQHADAMLAELRYREAAAEYADVESRAGDDLELVCRARYGRAKALLDGRSRTEGSVLMAEVAAGCTEDIERRVWARYHAGRAFSALGKNDLAIAQFEALVREASTHSLADDALYRAAKAARDMGDFPGMFARLAELSARYPNGDMVLRARFTLAWEARGQGDLARAIETLTQDDRDEPAEDVQGRSAYYRARWLGEAGDDEGSIDAFAAAFERAPLSFYGQLAHARLIASAPSRARALSSRLARARGERLTFEHRPELSSAGFRRAVALISVGEATLASQELRGLGFTSEGADVELALLSVAMIDRADAPDLAVELARRHMPRLMQRPPIGKDVALYELAYPMAYAPLIESVARKENVPAAFLRAVAREESGFNPEAVSRAHAYGLVQLLLPTARALVQTKRERIRAPESLLKPELNLALGARFMGTLAAGLRGQYALVPAAYNAGPSAVARWIRERGTQAFDEWIESIPYDETRGYTRRVVQSYGVYHWLATAELLPMPLGPVGTPPAPRL